MHNVYSIVKGDQIVLFSQLKTYRKTLMHNDQLLQDCSNVQIQTSKVKWLCARHKLVEWKFS